MRWETANADGKNAAFDPAMPGPKFRAPDRTAAVARALPLVAAAHRSGPFLSCPCVLALQLVAAACKAELLSCLCASCHCYMGLETL